MKIAAWNVNSVRARLPHVLEYLSQSAPDILLLQETKTADETFPFAELQDAGYETAHYGQKSYNGVAIVSRLPLSDIVKGMPNRPKDEQARVIAATVEYAGAPLRAVSVYAPNGQNLESEKYEYKLEWYKDFCDYLGDAKEKYGAAAAGGDYNIAPADADIYDAAEWGEEVLASPPERAALNKIFAEGFYDAHRLFDQPEKSFSWWDYRAAAFRRNRGVRIDLILVSAALKNKCAACAPDPAPRGWERPSDHAPVIAAFK
ncbi:MAG: exodeoxyribonuclease III [Gammaproteobacteria bacterium]